MPRAKPSQTGCKGSARGLPALKADPQPAASRPEPGRYRSGSGQRRFISGFSASSGQESFSATAPPQGRSETHERYGVEFMVGLWWAHQDLNLGPKDSGLRSFHHSLDFAFTMA